MVGDRYEGVGVSVCRMGKYLWLDLSGSLCLEDMDQSAFREQLDHCSSKVGTCVLFYGVFVRSVGTV